VSVRYNKAKVARAKGQVWGKVVVSENACEHLVPSDCKSTVTFTIFTWLPPFAVLVWPTSYKNLPSRLPDGRSTV